MSVSTSKSPILNGPPPPCRPRSPSHETLASRMARKRRAPSPPPPPPQEEEKSSSEESSSGEEEEEAEGTHATQKPPQNPKPPSTAAANDADSSDEDDGEQATEESSDSEIDAEAFQLRHLARSPGNPSVVDSRLESDADDDDEEEPDSVQKTVGKKLKSEAGKKRLAPEPTPSCKAKKAKAEGPQLTPSGKAKKAKAEAEKAAAELSQDGKGKKAEAGPSPSSKSEKRSQVKRWTIEDEIKILETIVQHVKTKGTQPSTVDLIAAVGDSLDRKNCTKTEMYEKVRQFKQRYEITAKKVASTGTLPGKDDDVRKYKLSEAAWGENKTEVASASISQNDGASLKSKKGQTNKEKMDDQSKGGTAKEASTTANENVGALTGSKNGQSTKEKIDGDTKSRSSKKATTIDTPVKSKKRGGHKEGLEEDAKTGTAKETTTTATQDRGSLFSSKRGESEKEKIEGDRLSLGPKEATQNGGALTESKNGETHKEGMDIDANVQDIRKGFAELQNLYPNLTSYVESIRAQHPCGETMKRAFEFIDDEKACTLESKIKKQRVAEVKMEISRADTKKEVANMLIGLLD